MTKLYIELLSEKIDNYCLSSKYQMISTVQGWKICYVIKANQQLPFHHVASVCQFAFLPSDFFFSSLFTMWSLFVILSFRLVVSVCQFVFSPSGICLFFLSVCLSSHLSVVVSVRQFVFSTRASVCQSVFSQLVLSNVPKWFSSFF